MPLITIIIPTFNSQNYIDKLLESILVQTFKDYEIIVKDNLSKDRTVEKINQFSFPGEILRVQSEKDSGIYDAMNRGIELAKGEWIYFMGADDSLYDRNVLQNVSEHLAQPYDIVYGDVMWIPQKIKEAGEWDYSKFINRNINHQRIFYRRELFTKYERYNTRYKIAADHELNIRLFCNGCTRKKYVPITITTYHSGGFSANKTDELFWEDWNKTVLLPFKPYLQPKQLYGSLGNYCKYLLNNGRYSKALIITSKVFFHTGSLGFIKLMLTHFLNKKNAA